MPALVAQARLSQVRTAQAELATRLKLLWRDGKCQSSDVLHRLLSQPVLCSRDARHRFAGASMHISANWRRQSSSRTLPGLSSVLILFSAFGHCLRAEGDTHYGIAVSKNVMVVMRDGVRLATDIYLPTRNGQLVNEKFPTRHRSDGAAGGEALGRFELPGH